MCGIFGFYKVDDLSLADKMLYSLQHRGPDDSGLFNEKDITIGMTRLSIVDLETGSQPMMNEDNSLILVCNGEIYNAPELKEKLSAKHSFTTKSDVEVILHLYEEYHEHCVQFLRGMFAFCILDLNKKRIFLSVDKYGIKSLYYYLNAETFIFASEMKAILEYKCFTPEFNIDRAYVHSYFDLGNWTHIKQIKVLEPSQMLQFDFRKQSEVVVRKYWDQSYTDLLGFENEEEVLNQVEQIIDHSVNIHLQSDVPIGFLISGGVDSNTIAAYAKKYYEKQFNTFTFGSPIKNEFEPARLMANFLESKHCEILFHEEEVIQNFPKVMWAIETPEPRLFDASIPTYLIYKEIKKYCKVVFCGEGGDEVFGGYVRYFLHLYNQKDALRKQFSDHVESLYRLNCRRIDKISMAHSVEARVPLLDNKLVEYMAKVDCQLKIKDKKDKYILRTVAENVIPDVIAWRKKEQSNTGTGMPEIITKWIKKNLSDKVLSNFPVQNLPQKNLSLWQPHSAEIYQKYNMLLTNMFYKQFILRDRIKSVEDILSG